MSEESVCQRLRSLFQRKERGISSSDSSGSQDSPPRDTLDLGDAPLAAEVLPFAPPRAMVVHGNPSQLRLREDTFDSIILVDTLCITGIAAIKELHARLGAVDIVICEAMLASSGTSGVEIGARLKAERQGGSTDVFFVLATVEPAAADHAQGERARNLHLEQRASQLFVGFSCLAILSTPPF